MKYIKILYPLIILGLFCTQESRVSVKKQLEQLILNGIDPVTHGFTPEQVREVWAEIVSQEGDFDGSLAPGLEKNSD